MSEAPILDMVDLVRVHGRGAAAVRALDGISLTVRRGELVAVTGPSGSGKSTLLNIAGGLDRPTSGVVSVEERALEAMSAKDLARLRRRRVGYVFQDFNLVPTLTALENVALPLELDGVRSRTAWPEASRALEEVGIADLARRFPHELSGGQQQRTAIARALLVTHEARHAAWADRIVYLRDGRIVDAAEADSPDALLTDTR
jgi:putative ABC transport system ATP-binding protein